MLKKIAAAALVAGSLGLAVPAHAVACVELHVNVNGTGQDIVQCV